MPEITRRKLHLDIYGLEGTGRTSLALTAPGPIALLHDDEKIEGITQKQTRKGKRIRVVSFGVVATTNLQETADEAQVTWARFQNANRDSLLWAGSTVWDTGTAAWEVVRLARFGTLKPEGRMDALYGPVNAEFNAAIKQFRGTDTNLVTIHKMKDKYKEGIKDGKKYSVNTGEQIRAGFKEIGYAADVVVRTWKEAGVFKATIEKGWYNAYVEGMTLEGEDIRFSNIMAMISELPEEEWL